MHGRKPDSSSVEALLEETDSWNDDVTAGNETTSGEREVGCRGSQSMLLATASSDPGQREPERLECQPLTHDSAIEGHSDFTVRLTPPVLDSTEHVGDCSHLTDSIHQPSTSNNQIHPLTETFKQPQSVLSIKAAWSKLVARRKKGQRSRLRTSDTPDDESAVTVVEVSDEVALLGQVQQTQSHTGGMAMWLRKWIRSFQMAVMKSVKDLIMFMRWEKYLLRLYT